MHEPAPRLCVTSTDTPGNECGGPRAERGKCNRLRNDWCVTKICDLGQSPLPNAGSARRLSFASLIPGLSECKSFDEGGWDLLKCPGTTQAASAAGGGVGGLCSGKACLDPPPLPEHRSSTKSMPRRVTGGEKGERLEPPSPEIIIFSFNKPCGGEIRVHPLPYTLLQIVRLYMSVYRHRAYRNIIFIYLFKKKSACT